MPLADYFDPHERVRDVAAEADKDSDAVSLDYLLPSGDLPDEPRLPDEPIDGAIVFIKGDANVRAFEAWAVERGLLTPGKPWADPPAGAN